MSERLIKSELQAKTEPVYHTSVARKWHLANMAAGTFSLWHLSTGLKKPILVKPNKNFVAAEGKKKGPEGGTNGSNHEVPLVEFRGILRK